MNKQYLQLLIDTTADQNLLQSYLTIIEVALSEQRIKVAKDHPQYIYYETHHILPRSLFPEYAKCKDNLVLLQPKEHFLVHKYLVTLYPGKQMAYAFWRMCCCKKTLHGVTADDFQEARLLYSQYGSPLIGYSPSKETREKLSQKGKAFWARGGYQHSKEQHQKGVLTRQQNGSYKQTAEQKKLKSDKLRGRIFITDGTVNKSIWPAELDSYLELGWRRGKKPLTAEHRANISKGCKGKSSWNIGLPGTFKGKHHTEEAKAKMRAAKKLRKLKQEEEKENDKNSE